MPAPNLKTTKYLWGDLIGDMIFYLSIPVFRRLPPRALIYIAKAMGTMTFYLIKKYRDRVMENLFIVYGRSNFNEIKRLAREIFFHFALTPLEALYQIAVPSEQFIMKIKIEGKDHLEAALMKGNGVIALGAHLGSFTLLGTRLAVEGYPFNVVMKEGNFPKLTKRMNAYARRLGQTTFPPKPTHSSIKKSMNCLRRNEILYLVADEQQRRGGLPVPFFGQTAYTPPGPAIFSIKMGAPILPMFVLREKGAARTLMIGNPIQIEPTDDERKDIESLTATFTKVIEEMVRQYPSQWAWLNRRWKLSLP
jgi:KDO2-lipid IV(A) lauroyltransferase